MAEELVAALAMLTAGMQRQQEQNQAMQAALLGQQDAITQLINQMAAVPVAAAPVAAAAVAVRAVMESDVRYAGTAEESLADWLQLVNRKAANETWNDGQKRRAAAGTLTGAALTCHDEIGVGIANWDAWLQGLRAAFEVRLSHSQWQLLVESRRQLPNESGSNYTMEKLKICRRCPTVLDEAQTILHLIRGLSTQFQTIMMVNPPATVAEFLVEIRRLEAICLVPALSRSEYTFPVSSNAACTTITSDATQMAMLKALEALTTQVSAMGQRTETQANAPATKSILKPQVQFQRRPPGT